MQIINSGMGRVAASNGGIAAGLAVPAEGDTGAESATESDNSADVASLSAKTADLPIINPVSHIDPALGIVVVETYGSDGAVENQYPTARMLRQYTLYGLNAGV